MHIIRTMRTHRLRLGLLVALLAALAAGLFAAAKAQGQECIDIGNLTVCGDELEVNEQPETNNYIQLIGNLKIGPKGEPPVIYVRGINELDFKIIDPLNPHNKAEFIHYLDGPDYPYGTQTYVQGELHFLKDERDLLLPQRKIVQSFQGRGLNQSTTGVYFVDVLNQRIYNPPADAVPVYEERGISRNEALRFHFLKITGMQAFLENGGSVEELDDVDIEFDIKNKVFNATVPINLKLNGDAENPDLRLTARVTINEKGEFNGSINGFRFNLAGLTAEARNVKITPATDQTSAQFEAATVAVKRADHPDLLPLEPEDPELLFRFEKLRYKDGDFSIGGGAVAIRDWEFGNAFKMTNQSLGVVFDQQTDSYALTIDSTLVFGGNGNAVSDPKTYPVTARIGAQKIGNEYKPLMRTSLNIKPSLGIGALQLQPETPTLVYDPVQDFYGLTTDKVNLAWNRQLGSQKGGALTGFKLGVNKDSDLIVEVGGGAFILPEVRTEALVGTVEGSLSVKNNQVTITGTGKLQIALTGNSNIAPGVTMIMRGGEGVGGLCPVGQTCNFAKPFEINLSSFDLKIAGFKLGLTNPQGTPDGGFAAERVALGFPVGITNIGGEIRWLSVRGNGDITIAGGGFELSPLTVGGFQFVGLKGFFAKNPAGGYEFKAAGTMPLPGLDPTSSKKIGVELAFREKPNGSFGFTGVVDFTTNSPGIPIGSTGMELLQIKGTLDINQGGPKSISVFMRAGSQYRVANMPLVTATGNATLQVQPFMMTANARLSVLVVDVAQASIGIGAGQGFNGRSGFNVSFEIDATVIHGGASLRMGDVVLSNGREKFVINARAFLEVGLKKNQFGRFLPPTSITLARVDFKGGTFKFKNRQEVSGLMGTVGCCIFFKKTLFYNFGNNDLGFVDADDYKLLGAEQVRAAIARGEAGYTSRALTDAEMRSMGVTRAAGGSTLQQERIPIEFDQQGAALFGIAFSAGNPVLRLQLPDGTMMTEQSVDNVTSTFLRDTTEEGDQELAFILKQAQPGTYSLIIDNAPVEYEKVSYIVNNEPELTSVSASCGGAPGDGVSVTCDGAVVGAEATVTWGATDSDSPDATVRVSYAQVNDSGAVDVINQRTLAADLPLGQGSYTWNLAEAPTGRYKLIVAVEDGRHAPVEGIANVTIDVTDQRAPAMPDSATINIRSLPGGLRVFWEPNTEEDIAGYEIGLARDFEAEFIYTRDIGIKEAAIVPGEGELPVIEADLWGLEDDEEVWVSVRAYDQSGNISNWSERVNQRPWPVAPDAWLPVPGTRASTRTRIEVAFATPLMPDKFVGMLELRDSSGKVVPGETLRVTNLAGDKVVGLRFTPHAPLTDGAAYEVFVNGSGDGLSTTDGRMMPDDYTWTFTADASLDPPPVPPANPNDPKNPGNPLRDGTIYLPLVVR